MRFLLITFFLEVVFAVIFLFIYFLSGLYKYAVTDFSQGMAGLMMGMLACVVSMILAGFIDERLK